jgi:alpha-amylase
LHSDISLTFASQDSVGYDIYDVYDLGEFDQKGSKGTKYGTKEQLKAAVEEAYKHGIVTYIDAVLNHKFGADEAQKVPVREVDSNDRTQFTTDVYEIEVR